ncbi:NAD-dependent epimerase/dehydratase family protein [Crassaminicella indica]|uniref:NAD-dependent epimerase/dehydratase family protein n=1 Tax=Crassaminicella indica TaxID=2855394 RepID=A0ABX8RCE7_9CLOT|nr:NAD-dependent epimerase/dehydratase family protein [Crassaminicella indica]QXM05395.1 NAD-dependent epimerase/dehydratase family protein [Crassaminicella indica]
MKCLVTGAAGFVGSHLCTTLLEQGNEVWGLDDLSTGKKENLDHLNENACFHFKVGCISNENLLSELIKKVDIIYHLAAIVGVKRYVEDPVKVINVNVCYTSKLLEIAWKLGKKVVFTSTSEIYGKSEDIPFKVEGNRVYGPSTTNRWCYAVSKTADEHLCLGYAKRGLPIVILRYFNAYGPRADTSPYGGVITRFIYQALMGKPLTVHADGSQTRCFTYIDDIIKGTIEAGKRSEAEGKIFNLGNHREISILNLAHNILEISEIKGKIIFQPYEEFYGLSYEDIPRRSPDLSIAEQILDYFPIITLEEGLKKTLNWYKKRLCNQYSI